MGNASNVAAALFTVAIAAAQGVLEVHGGAPTERVKKQKQILTERLQATFGIPSDPIPWDERQRAYVASFIVRDERSASPSVPPGSPSAS